MEVGCLTDSAGIDNILTVTSATTLEAPPWQKSRNSLPRGIGFIGQTIGPAPKVKRKSNIIAGEKTAKRRGLTTPQNVQSQRLFGWKLAHSTRYLIGATRIDCWIDQ
jgi:hypothetical protein